MSTTQEHCEHEEACARLRARTEAVLSVWGDHVRNEIPTARELDAEILRNNLPKLLNEIADVLVESIGKDAYAYARIPTAIEHAEQRARIPGYTLDLVILEYHLLRKAVVQVLDQEAPLSRGVASVIHDGIDRAMQEASVHFVEAHQQVCREHEERQRRLKHEAATLRQVDRAKDDYLALLAHELRMPLSTIRNALYVLGQLELGDERAFRQINAAARQTANLCRITEDLLDISRIARGKLELRLERVDLCRLAAYAAESVRPLVESRGHELETRLSPVPLLVEVDPVRIEQVLTNLMTHAAKYTEPNGRICVTVAAEGKEARASVRDNGIGIPPEKLPHVFDPFNQLGLSSTHSQGGLGIGLALSQRLVKLHGGRIQAASEGAGTGSEFSVWLPLAP